MNIQQWIDKKLKEISERLPIQIHQDPASFACGYNMGYKQAMIDLIRFYDDLDEQE